MAQILPLESADMRYIPIMDIDSMSNSGFLETPECYPYSDVINCYADYLPCWSLASLLDALPEIQCGKPIITLDDNYIAYPHMSDLYTKAYNLIDACVSMIEKLNELNLL